MKIEDLNGKIQKLNFPEEQKDAILGLIDAKADNDMEKLILTIDILRKELKTENESLKRELKTFLWVVGIALAIMTMIISIKS